MEKIYYKRSKNYTDVVKTSPMSASVISTSRLLEESKIQTIGDINPNWREQIAKKENACTARTVTFRGFDVVPCNFAADVDSQYGTYVGGQFVPYAGVLSARGVLVPTPIGVTPEVYNWTNPRAQGRAKAIAKVSQAHHSAMAGVFAGEILQTLNMLRHPLEALRSGFHNYFAAVEHNVRDAKTKSKKLRVRGINQRSKKDTVKSIIADTYLEYVFGWTPLLNDAKDTITALDRLLTQHKVTRADSKFVFRDSGIGVASFDYGQAGLKLKRETRSNVIYTLSTKAALEPVVDHDFHTQFGLDLESFAPTVWELIPWSFVFDYFVNAQELINSAFTVRSEVVYVSQTEIRETFNTTVVTWPGLKLDPAAQWRLRGVVANTPGVITEKIKVVERVCAHQFPPLSVTVPSRKQLLNLAALLASHNKATYSIRGS